MNNNDIIIPPSGVRGLFAPEAGLEPAKAVFTRETELTNQLLRFVHRLGVFLKSFIVNDYFFVVSEGVEFYIG